MYCVLLLNNKSRSGLPARVRVERTRATVLWGRRHSRGEPRHAPAPILHLGPVPRARAHSCRPLARAAAATAARLSSRTPQTPTTGADFPTSATYGDKNDSEGCGGRRRPVLSNPDPLRPSPPPPLPGAASPETPLIRELRACTHLLRREPLRPSQHNLKEGKKEEKEQTRTSFHPPKIQ